MHSFFLIRVGTFTRSRSMYVNGSDIWESGLIDLMFDELFMYE